MGWGMSNVVGAGKGGAAGAGVGGAVLGPAGAIYGGVSGGMQGGSGQDPVNHWANSLGFKNDAAKSANAQQARNVQANYDANSGVVNQMKDTDQSYAGSMNNIASDSIRTARGIEGDWQQKARDLAGQAAKQATDASTVYNGTVAPNLQNIMETAKTNAGNAMTLKDSMDPNNSVQTAYRGMYDQQAQGANRQGQADAGVLGAMGTQATMGAMQGGAPMTGSQLAALQGANMTQSSQAMAQAQQYANNLRQQGIQTGIDQSNLAYQNGVGAQKTYADSVNNIQGANNSYNQGQQAFRGEQSGYSDAIANARNGLNQYETNMDMGNASLGHDLATGQGNRQIGLNNSLYGGQNAVIGQGAQAQTAQNAANMGFFSGALGAGAGVAGAAMGAPRAPAAPTGGGYGTAGAAAGEEEEPQAASRYPSATQYA